MIDIADTEVCAVDSRASGSKKILFNNENISTVLVYQFKVRN